MEVLCAGFSLVLALYKNIGAKGARKMWMKLTPVVFNSFASTILKHF
jgi:hypothetical protein